MKKSAENLVYASLITAITCVLTLISIPLPYGYANLGDAGVLLGAYILPTFWSGIAGGVGCMLADLILGYAIYAPGTLIIKFIVGILASIIYKKKKNVALAVFAGVVGEMVMVAGYFLYESLVLNYGFGAAVSIFGNSMQGILAIIVSSLFALIMKNKR